MTEGPAVDDRSREELFDALVDRADVYVDEWDPRSAGTGRTLLRIFSKFEADVRKRLNDAPEKHRIAFLDALDFDRRPPQAARVPLTFQVSNDLDRNVAVPGGTQAVADAGAGTPQLFEVPQDGGFEATGASLADVIAVDPAEDAIVDHGAVLEGDEPVELFAGPSLQEHVLYVGNDDLLNLRAGSTLTITAETNVDGELFSEAVVWEYYGEDPTGEEGWHRLERTERDDRLDDTDGLEALQERLRSRSSDGAGAAAGDGTASETTFRFPGTTVEREVSGVESRWLRCRLDGESAEAVSASVERLTVRVGSAGREGGLAPDLLLSNDVPLSPDDGDIKPLGRLPQPPASFYVACEEAFTKPGGTVDLEFAPPAAAGTTTPDGPDGADAEYGADGTDARSESGAGVGAVGGPPRLSWEYWNGDGWARLDSVEDGTNALREAGAVRFTVPDDIEPTAVSGHENVWIRARLVGGNYGQPSFDVTDEGTGRTLVSEPDPPQYGDVTVRYDRGGQPFETIVRYNNASYSEDLSDRGGSFSPFVDLPDDAQTLYLGFDGAMRDGPITLFVPVEDATYPRSFDPGAQWEYCVDPAEFEWETLDVQDRTGGLTERGIVSLTFPEETVAFELFGRDRHWIRVRVTNDEFDRPRPAGDRTASTAADRAERSTTPPVLEGIHPNTQWAFNTDTIENEILGSSDGTHDQSFACAHAPVIDIDVWVDELSTLSSGDRRRLVERRPDDVDRVYDSRGEVAEFWVRWTAVRDFLDSGPTDRHYVVNRTLGTLEFGDGDRGAIPPDGNDNVRATYTTGGGSDGNVDAGTITDLKSSVSLVEAVSNPAPADGGADIESMDALVDRSTNRIRHRGKAVTAADYEQVAMAEFRELSKVKCDSSPGGDDRRVVVLVVPEARREKPVPSMELKHRVRAALYDRAPASVAESGDVDIVVRGPGYAELSVEATVRASNVKSVSLLKGTVRQRLDDFLHPLTGDDGTGWSFGELPSVDELVERVAGVETVSDVVEFGATVDAGGERRSLTGHDADAALASDTLVCSGTHDITVTTEESP